MVDVPHVLVAQVPQVLVVEEAVEIPQLQAVKKIGVIPETFETSQLQLEGTQTSESLNTGFLRRVTQAENSSFFSVGVRSVCQDEAHHTAAKQPTTSGKTSQHDRREGERKGRKEERRRKGWNEWDVMRKADRESKAKGERGKEEKGRDAEEEEREQVKKDVTGWTVVTRSNKHRKRTVQIFVKADGGKTRVMEMETSDKVDDAGRSEDSRDPAVAVR